MPAHSQPPSKQATIALSYASSQSRTTKQATIALSYASAQSSTTQTSNNSSQLCQLIVQHHPNKQPKLSVMPAHSLAPSKQATIALSYASSQSSTTKNMQPQLTVMPAHSPAPPKQATLALSYASSQSSTTQTSNYSSQLCQIIVQHHTNKQLQLSVMPAHSPAPPKQATIALSYARSLSSTTQTSNYSSQLGQLIVQHHQKHATIALSYASSQSSTTQTSNYSSQLCQLIVQHHPNKQLQLSVMPAHRPAPPKQATIALSYASSQSSTTQSSNHSSQNASSQSSTTQRRNYSPQLCQLIVQHHSNKQLQLSVMPAHSPVPPNQATIALSYASSQSCTTQKSNYSSQLCLLIDQHHTNKQLYRSVMPAHSPAPPKQATIALSYASSWSSTKQTSNYSSLLCQLIDQHHPNKQLQLQVMPAHSQPPSKQATIALSYASSQSRTTKQATIALSYASAQSSTTQTSNYSSQLCQLIVQHHPNKQPKLSVMPAHSLAPSKQATIALSYASSQSSTTQTCNHSSHLCQLIVQHHTNKQLQLSVIPAHSPVPHKQATIALSYASSQSSTIQTSNYSSQLCQLIVQHHPNMQPQLSVMPAHRPAPPKQATIALSYASSQSSTTQSSNHSSQNASSQSSTTQTSNHSSQLCQLIVQHHSNKQLQLSVMPAHSPVQPKQATISLSYASSQSSTIQTSNQSSQLCQLIVQDHPNKQLQLSVMPAHSPAQPKQANIALSCASSQSSTTQSSNYSSLLCQLIVQRHPIKQPQLSVLPAHSQAPPKQATLALSYASSQSSTTQTSNHSSQLCQFIVQHHSNKQLQLSVMTVRGPAPPKLATISLSYASSWSSTTQTSNYSSLLCQLIDQHHPNKQLQLSVMPAHGPAPNKQATIALCYASSQPSTIQTTTLAFSYASSQSSTTQTSNYSSQSCQLTVQQHPNKQVQLSVMPAHSPAPLKQATIALSYASSQPSTIQTSKYSSQLWQLIVQHYPNKQPWLSVMPAHSPAPPKQATIALSYASSQSSTTQTSNYSSQLCQPIVQHNPNKQPQLSVMPAHSPAPPKQTTITLSYASSQSSSTQTSNYSSQLCQLIVQHHPNKQLQLSVMPAHSPAPPKQATISLSYASSQSSTTQTSNHSSQLCQFTVQHHPIKQLQLSVMPAHCPASPKQATIALSFASSQSSTTQTSNHSSQLCQLIVQHHPNKQPQVSAMPAHSLAPPQQATIALSYASSWSSTKQTSNYSSLLYQLIDQHHPNKQLQFQVIPAHSPAAPNQATIALSYASSQPSTIQTTTIALSYASSQSSTTQTSNFSSQSCQLIVQQHPNKQVQLSVMPAHSPAPPKQATIALNYASSKSSTTQTSNYSSQLCQLIVLHLPNQQLQLSVMPAHSPAPPKQATIALSYASSQSSTTQTSNYSSKLCQIIVQYHPNKQPKLSVMPAHSLAPSKQATIALSVASSQTSTQQTSNHSSQLCQLIVNHHPNKQPQLSVLPAHSQAPPKQATIALSYASSQSSTIQTINQSSQLCQLIVQHHPNKQLQLSVMPAHSPAPPKHASIALSYASSQSSSTQTSNYSSQLCQLIVQHHPNKQLQLSVMPAHSPAPPKQATISLSYASSQSSTTQTSNHSSQLCQFTVQHHPIKQLQLSVMPAHCPASPKQATIALSFASSQSSTTQTSNHSSQLCQLIVQHHPNKQPQVSAMPAHSLAPPQQATIALSYASSWSSTKQTSNYSSLLYQLIDQHHPNKQLQFQVIPAHSPAAPNQATIALSYASSQPSTIQTTTIALSYASSQSSTTQTSNFSSQSCQLIVQQHPNKQVQLSVMPAHSPAPPKQATIALNYASSKSSTTQTSNYSSQLCQLIVLHLPNQQLQLSLCQLIVQHHPNKQLQLSVMPAHSQAPPKQATIALSYARSLSSTIQTSNQSSQLCQLIVQHHPNKQPQLSVLQARRPAHNKQVTIALSYASSQSTIIQTSNHSSQFCQLTVKHHPNKQLQLSVMPAHSPAPSKQATKALSYASSQSSTIQTSNYSSQLCQLIVQHPPNMHPQLSVMPAHSSAPPKQATIALSYASSQSSTTQSSNHSSQNASSQSSTTQRRNYSPQLCQLIVQHHSNKQLQLSVMPAHSPVPPKQATIALSCASSQSSTTQKSNYSSQLCLLIDQHHTNKQLYRSVMPAHSPAPPKQQIQHSVMRVHSPAPPKQATIALSYASSQSSTTETSNHSSQLCQLIVQHHPNKQLHLSVMPAHNQAPPKQATKVLSYASSQSSTTQTSNNSSQLCQLTVQHHPNKQLQLSVMPAHSLAPNKQATKALSYEGSESSTTQTSNHSSQLSQLIVQHHPNKQPQLSVMPTHSPAPPKQATIALKGGGLYPKPTKL